MIRYGVNPSAGEWKQDGVCFPNEAGCLRQVIENTLEQAA